MSRSKLFLSLAAALGLTALAATTFAHQSGADQQSAKPARDPAGRVGGQASADVTPGGFTFIGGSHPGSSKEEVGLSIEADQLVRQLGQAKTDGEKETFKARISDILNKQFD